MHAVFNVRSEPTAEDWLAAIFARNKLGMAMAAIIRMIATTIKSSINEKPFCLLRMGLTSAFYVHVRVHRRGKGQALPFCHQVTRRKLSNRGAACARTRTRSIRADHTGLIGVIHVLSGGGRSDWLSGY